MDSKPDDRRTTAAAFARRLSSLMRNRGMSQTKLAEMRGTRQPVVSRLCNGYVVPRIDTVAKLRDALGCTWEDLLGE